MAQCLFNINKYKSNNTDILTCDGDVASYTNSNFVYLILINFINNAINGNSEINEGLVNDVIKKIDKKYGSKCSDMLQSASYHVKQYIEQLHFYEYLGWLCDAKKKYGNEEVDNVVKWLHYISGVKFISKDQTKTAISTDILSDAELIVNFSVNYNKTPTDVFTEFPEDKFIRKSTPDKITEEDTQRNIGKKHTIMDEKNVIYISFLKSKINSINYQTTNCKQFMQ